MKKSFFIILAVFAMFVSPVWGQEKTKKVYLVADAHLDTQWNWDVQTTIREYIKNTLNQNLFLIRQYPDYIFNFEGGVKYAWMKEYYPLQYEELKKYIAAGRWHVTGSSWDACESIICSPESWIRNVLLGQTFYRREFGTEGTDIFLPDCFGFPYTLPTLATHCGLIGFSSQKLVWRTKPFYEGNRRYPFSVGLWQGIDGSRIMMAHGFDYGRRWNDEDLSKNEHLLRAADESPLGIAYHYYGTGDTGGSPDLSSVRAVEKGIKGQGPITIVSAASDQLYKDFLPYENHSELPVFDGELTMDLHGNGCYTSQAAMKLYNRQNEHLGDAAERMAVMADWLGVSAYPSQLLTDAWKRVIWHQFHDDLTGTSIPRAYEFSWNDELLSLKDFSHVLTHSASGVVGRMDTRVKGVPVVVYNNEAFPVNAIADVELNDTRNYQVTTHDGRKVLSQVVEKNGSRHLLFDASVPSVGLSVYSLRPAQGNAATTSASHSIENSQYRLEVDSHGDVVSVFDKQYLKELVAPGKSIRLVVLDDCHSPRWPAWEVQKATLDKEAKPIHDDVEVTASVGLLRKTLHIRKRYGDSEMVQRIHLYEGGQCRRIDFENVVDWKSLNALLKAEFPLSVSNQEATYDIGLGNVKRGNNSETAFEVYSHEWTDLTDRSGDYGVTILNDSRYGWDKPNDNTLRLSLLYSPSTDAAYAYQARQDFGHHVFTYSIVGHEGGLDNVAAARWSTQLNSPLKTFTTPKHKGMLGSSFSFVSSDNDNVMVRALKQAETDNEYVVRVYEVGGQQAQTARLTFASAIVKAVETDGTEKTIGNAAFQRAQLVVDVKANSLKTYKVTLDKQEATTVDVQPIVLPHDRKCFSYNEFRSSANFEGGYSYAAELMPEDGITVDGIRFRFGELDGLNGTSCKGQRLSLPADKSYRHLYLLAASDKGDRKGDFVVGGSRQSCTIPFYSGFIGQWGHDGQTEGFLKDAQVAYVGTHRHSSGADEPYEFTYMFKIKVDLPKDAREIILPDDAHIVVFAVSLANDEDDLCPASEMFETSLRENTREGIDEEEDGPNLLKNARITTVTGETNENEKAVNLTDGNPDTKWCDVKPSPNHVTFDLGKPTVVSKWRVLNAGAEDFSYITRTCLLQGRNSETEEWVTLDMFDGNRNNSVARSFTPATVRYVRLYVVSPEQGTGGAARIYELEIY